MKTAQEWAAIWRKARADGLVFGVPGEAEEFISAVQRDVVTAAAWEATDSNGAFEAANRIRLLIK